MPDLEWMQVELVVSSWEKLIAGDKIPKGVSDAIEKRAKGCQRALPTYRSCRDRDAGGFDNPRHLE